MLRLALLPSMLVLLLAASDTSAQVPAPPSVRRPPAAAAPAVSIGELPPTPEMWFYQQARQQYEDPRQAVRAAAEFRAAQRMNRMAARRWFGYSNMRPIASTTPTHSTSSPGWRSNSYDPFLWTGTGRPNVVVLPGASGAPGYR